MSTESLWGEPNALTYNYIQEAMDRIHNCGISARDIETINWWEEHDMSNIDTSTAKIRHDEIVTEGHWEYTVRDGDGDLWEATWVSEERDEPRFLECWKAEIANVRRLRDEGHEWYPAEDYPEPLTVVKRHVRVTTEYSNWEEA